MSKALAKIPAGVSPAKQEQMLLQMRRKARNEKLAMDRLVGRIVGIASAAGGAIAMGWYIGTRMKQGKSTKVGGADLEIIVGPVLALTGAFIQSKTKKTLPRMFGEFIEGGGVGIIAYYAGSRMEQAAQKAGSTPVPQQLRMAA